VNAPSENFRKSTWVTLLLVVIAGFFIFVLLPVFVGFCGPWGGHSTIVRARKTIDTISMAMEDYRKDFNAYPPEIGTNGSRMIATYLTRVFTTRDSHFGPYLKVSDSQLTNSDGKHTSNLDEQQFLSPLGGEYAYVILKEKVNSAEKETGYVLVDPGRDKLLGGAISNRTGFEVTDPKTADDNLYEPIQIGSRKTIGSVP
jgi:hypothetical protein